MQVVFVLVKKRDYHSLYTQNKDTTSVSALWFSHMLWIISGYGYS